MATTLVNTGVQFPDNSIQTTAAASVIPAGAVMLFVQTAAPTGWTKLTTHNNKALRVVSGTAGTGGSVNFTTAFASKSVAGAVGNHTLTVAQLPAHEHFVASSATRNGNLSANNFMGNFNPQNNDNFKPNLAGTSTAANRGRSSSVGTSQPHNHAFTGTAINLAVQYVDVIIATKN